VIKCVKRVDSDDDSTRGVRVRARPILEGEKVQTKKAGIRYCRE
jgi:hypothetical protein